MIEYEYKELDFNNIYVGNDNEAENELELNPNSESKKNVNFSKLEEKLKNIKTQKNKNNEKEEPKTRISKVTGKKVVDYVDNKVLRQDIIDYNKIYYEAIEKGLPKPKMPDSIGKAILDIGNGIASRYNFRGYTYIDEMLNDSIVQAVYSITKFNGEKFDNPHAYITMVMSRRMCQRIKEEKVQHKIIEDLMQDPNYNFYVEDENNNSGMENISKEDLVNFYYEGKLND